VKMNEKVEEVKSSLPKDVLIKAQARLLFDNE